jgi:penicillin amidase
MPNWLKITIGIVSTLIIVSIFAGIIFFGMLKKSLPAYEGTIESEKINDDIFINTDSVGIPHIIAQNDNDVAFALGYLHAKERLFSMDLYRRAGEGRLSEIFGKRTLKFDELFRTIGITRTIKENFNKYDKTTLSLLKSYADGMNYFIGNNKSKLPIEFDLLGYEPEPWTEIHSLLMIRMMAWELNLNWWADFIYAELIEKFGVEKASEILPDVSTKDLNNIPKSSNSISGLAQNFLQSNFQFKKFFGLEGSQIGSNNWVVDGKKSSSGEPIIANDPHLPYSVPSKWYLAAIKTQDEILAGVTLPGVPGIVIGTNSHIAWALTNLMNDETDFYLEKIDSSKKNYFLDNKWQPLKVIKDTIKIKNHQSKIIQIASTHRGPIISDVHQMIFFYNEDKKSFPAISMHWLGLEFSDEMFAFYRINKAKNFQEFKEAVSDFSVPGQNFLYADKDGNIGYIAGAKIPIRSSNSSSIISDGTKSSNDWLGFVSKNEMITYLNPANGFLATANSNHFDKLNFYITHLWEPSSRFDRINELLRQKEIHSVENFKQYQFDQISKYAEQIVPQIIAAFDEVKIKDKNLKQALELFENWDYKMDAYSQTASIYQIFINKLLKNIYYDEMDEDLYNQFLFVASVPYRSLMKILISESAWFNDVKSGKTYDKNSIIRKSLADALTYLETNYGKDIKLWQWGRIHKVMFKHPLSGAFKPVDKLINLGPFEIGGDGTTIFNTEYSFAKKPKMLSQFFNNQFDNVLGPSMRFIYDFGTPDEINIVLTSGQSGNIFSEHYSDMSDFWLKGKYYKINISESSFTSSDKKKLIIKKKMY